MKIKETLDRLRHSEYSRLIFWVFFLPIVFILKWVFDVFDDTLVSISELFKIAIIPAIIASIILYIKYKSKFDAHPFGVIALVALLFWAVFLFSAFFLAINYIGTNKHTTEEVISLDGKRIKGRRQVQSYFIIPHKGTTIEIRYYGDKSKMDNLDSVLLVKRPGLLGYDVIEKKKFLPSEQ